MESVHAFEPRIWRKLTKDAVYAWSATGKVWRERHESIEYWTEQFINTGKAIERPKPVENPLPNGLRWFEHATHWNPDYGGLPFTNEEHYWQGQWRKWREDSFNFWAASPDTIKRFPEGVKAQAIKQEPKPEPKKPVGWWN
ncbi:hypothetical protein D3C77_248740 [compost metagenome]